MPPKYRPSSKQPPTRNAALASLSASPAPQRQRRGKIVRAGEDELLPPHQEPASEVLASANTSRAPKRQRRGKIVRAGEDEVPLAREETASVGLAHEESAREGSAPEEVVPEELVQGEDPAHEWLDPLLRARHAPTGDNAGICRHSPGASTPESSPLTDLTGPKVNRMTTDSSPQNGARFVKEVRNFYIARSDFASCNYFSNLCNDFNTGGLQAVEFFAQVWRLLHVSGAEQMVEWFNKLVPQAWKKEFEVRGQELLKGATMAEKEKEVQGWAERVRMKVLEKMLAEESHAEEDEDGVGELNETMADEHVTAPAEGVVSEGSGAGDAPSDRQKWADLARALSAETDDDDDDEGTEYPGSEYGDDDNHDNNNEGEGDINDNPDGNDIDMPDPISHEDPATPAVQRKKKRPTNGYRASPVSHIVGIDGSMFEGASSLRRMSSGPPSSPAPARQVTFHSKSSTTSSPAKVSAARRVTKTGSVGKGTPTKAASTGLLGKRSPKKAQEQEKKSLVVRLKMPKGWLTTPPDVATTRTPATHTTPAKPSKNATPPLKSFTPTPTPSNPPTSTPTALTSSFQIAARPEQTIYPTTRAIFARAHKPYTHALCGQTFTHFEEVRRHHNGQAGRPGCWEKAGKPTGEVARWDAHETCQWSTKDILWRAVEGGVVVEDWGDVNLQGVREKRAGGVGEAKRGTEGEGEARASKRRKVGVDEAKDIAKEKSNGVVNHDSNTAGESTAEPKPKRRKLEGGAREVEGVDAAEQAALRSAATGLRKRK